MSGLLAVAVFFALLWLVLVALVHVSAWAVHLLVIVAVIALVAWALNRL